jgi:hypothetical protein
MRVFSAYTMNLLMELPFCHVLALYHMAEKAVSLFRFDVLIGNASLHDEQMAKGLQRVAKTATIPDREKFKELTSKQNIEAIIKRAREKRLVNA